MTDLTYHICIGVADSVEYMNSHKHGLDYMPKFSQEAVELKKPQGLIEIRLNEWQDEPCRNFDKAKQRKDDVSRVYSIPANKLRVYTNTELKNHSSSS